MTPNEINFVKNLIDSIENKNDQIIKFSTQEAFNKIDEVRENWLAKYEALQEELDQAIEKYNHLVYRLKRDGFICDEIRKEIHLD
jgi:pyruvate-formate lyase